MIVLESSNQVADDVPSSATCPAPSGIASGDLLIAAMSASATSAAATGFSSSEWRTAGFWSGQNGPSDFLPPSAILWKVASGSEPSSYTFSKVGNSSQDQFIIHISRWSGVDTSDPFAVDPTNLHTGSGNNVVAPSITIPSDLSSDAVLFTHLMAFRWLDNNGTGRWSTPSGMTKITDLSGPWTQMTTDYQFVESGSTGTRSATVQQNPQNYPVRGVSLALRPDGNGGEPVPTGPEPGRFLLAV